MRSQPTARKRSGRRVLVQRGLTAIAVAALILGAVVVRQHGGFRHVYQRVHDLVLIESGAGASKLMDAHGANIVRFNLSSNVLHRTLPEIVVLPHGFQTAQHRPLVVFLHGRGSQPKSLLNDALTDALARTGTHAPVVLLANGGETSYYHDRKDGKWGTYITDELVGNVVRKYRLDSKRVAFAGISMGGNGALELTREADRRLCGVAGLAPALWLSASESAPGAFDDAADFYAHDPLGAIQADNTALHGTPVYLAGGADDPFRAATDAMAAALQGGPSSVIRKRGSGGHNGLYWNAQFRPMMEWFAQRFDDC